MNKCIFLGRFATDIELKALPNSDTSVANFRFAVSRKFKRDGQPTADFLNCVAFGKVAENLNKYCAKGTQVVLGTRVQVRSWENQEHKKVYITEFLVEEFSFADSKKTGDEKESFTPVYDSEDEDLPF